MTLLVQAIRIGGLNRARIRDALSAVRSFQGVTGEIIFDATQNDSGPIWLAEVRDSAFRFFPSPLHEGLPARKNASEASWMDAPGMPR